MFCRIQKIKRETDLYQKETDKIHYLMPSSCHPRQTTNLIPFSLGLRIVRVCSSPETREIRMEELRERLLARQYNKEIVDSALNKARAVPRDRALRISNKPKKTQRPVLVVPYDPRLPAITSIIAKHWRSMGSQDSYL